LMNLCCILHFFFSIRWNRKAQSPVFPQSFIY
jgi:hypothetical protein